MKIIYEILFLFLITTISYSQNTLDTKYINVDDTINIYQCKYDTLYQVASVPENILDLGYDFIIITRKIDTLRLLKIKEYEIDWPSTYIDGRFYFVVTPRQIYLRTGHDNPNPEFLLWVKNINYEIFNKIILSLTDSLTFKRSQGSCGEGCVIVSYENYKAELKIPDEWTTTEIIKHENNHYEMLYNNFVTIINVLNRKLANSEQLRTPSFEAFKAQRNVPILSGLFELDDYLKNKILKIE